MNTVAIHGNVTGVKRLVFECFEALPLFAANKESRLGGRRGQMPIGANGLPIIPNKTTTPPLISNRWEMSQTPDPETYLNGIEIRGKAVFRTDALSYAGITVDQLREYIMPPLTVGYIRTPPEVVVSSSGNEVTYRVVDKQQMMNNPGGRNWGVHDVHVMSSCVANNPIDVVQRRFRKE
jgi:hypothetical protein